ncbi:uncharacterized protein BJX67DRAFT_271471 [Aspergillus lucknowensis]|uniref:Uncharacterized protein n=1 Tax=Aspergillus lucknowensis TaxID=176173 RepID=A0ABR4LF37_9EURO
MEHFLSSLEMNKSCRVWKERTLPSRSQNPDFLFFFFDLRSSLIIPLKRQEHQRSPECHFYEGMAARSTPVQVMMAEDLPVRRTRPPSSRGLGTRISQQFRGLRGKRGHPSQQDPLEPALRSQLDVNLSPLLASLYDDDDQSPELSALRNIMFKFNSSTQSTFCSLHWPASNLRSTIQPGQMIPIEQNQAGLTHSRFDVDFSPVRGFIF